MLAKYFRIVSLITGIALVPALAFAQAAGSSDVSVSSVPSSNMYTAGTVGAAFGTVTLTATQQGSFQVASLPLTLSTNSNGGPSDLSDCQLVNSAGTSLNTGTNVLNALSLGTNTITFDAPLTVSYGSPVTLTIRCNLSSGTLSGSTFTFTANSATLTASLMAALTVFPTISAGANSAPIGIVTLNPSASGGNLDVSSLQLTATYGNGLASSDLSNCHLALSGTILDTKESGLLAAGTNTLVLDNPLFLAGGSAAVPLMLSCAVSSVAPVDGSLALSLAPANILANNSVNNVVVTPTQGVDPSTGVADSLGGTTVVGTSGSTVTVVAPNTGAGATAPRTVGLLIGSALLALLGIAYLGRTRYEG